MTCDIELLEGVGLQNKHRQAKGHASLGFELFQVFDCQACSARSSDPNMDDSDHIIWQSSQPKCEALTVLMSKAQRPNSSTWSTCIFRFSSSIHRHKEQTTALAQNWSQFHDFESSQSSSSSSSFPVSSSLGSSSLRTRKNKRRRPVPSESDSESQLDAVPPFTPTPQSQLASPSKLVSLIRNASQSIEESSEMKRRSLERARQKAKRKEKERKKPSAQPRVIATEQLLDKLRKRESEATRSFKVAKGKGREEARVTPRVPVESSAMDVDDDAARMPPPPNLPARFVPPSRSETSTKERERGDSSSTSRSSSLTCSQSDPSITFSSSQSESSTAMFSTQSDSTNTSIDSPPPQRKFAPPLPPPNPMPSEQHHPPSSQASQKSKTRVLGMRRYATTPSSSQQTATSAPANAPLPTRQKQFKPPLVKRASLLASIQAALSETPSSGIQPAKSSEVAQAPRKANSASKADDSFESMDMDLDELWAACSAYD